MRTSLQSTFVKPLGFGLVFALCMLCAAPLQSGGAEPASDDSAVKHVYGKLADEPWQAQQNKGDVAVGVIVYEKDGKLYLDGQPCSRKFYNFTQPYDKAPTGSTVRCGDDTFQEFRVRQK